LSTLGGSQKVASLRKPAAGKDLFDKILENTGDIDPSQMVSTLNLGGKEINLSGKLFTKRVKSYVDNIQDSFDSGVISTAYPEFKNKKLGQAIKILEKGLSEKLKIGGLSLDDLDLDSLLLTQYRSGKSGVTSQIKSIVSTLGRRPPKAVRNYAKENGISTNELAEAFNSIVDRGDIVNADMTTLLRLRTLRDYKMRKTLPKSMLREKTRMILSNQQDDPFMALDMVKYKGEKVSRVENLALKGGEGGLLKYGGKAGYKDVNKILDYLTKPAKGKTDNLLLDFVGGEIEPSAARLSHGIFNRRVNSAKSNFINEFEDLLTSTTDPSAKKQLIKSIRDLHKQIYSGLNFKFSDAYSLKSKDIYGDLRKGVRSNALRMLLYSVAGNRFATGGKVFGEGGPTSDSILARVSNGEFVLNAEAARSIGYGKLEHMNKTGDIPAFKDGGVVGSFFRNISNNLSGFTEYLSDKRMKDVYREKEGVIDELSSLAGQGGLAAVELATILLNIPASAASGAEGIVDYVLSNDVGKIASDIGDVASAIKDQVKEKGIGTLTKQIGSNILDAAKEDISKGGLGITAGIMEVVSGAAFAKALKGKTVLGAVKDGLVDATTDLPSMRKSLGKISLPGVDIRSAGNISEETASIITKATSTRNIIPQSPPQG
jgi:hypothetical protein